MEFSSRSPPVPTIADAALPLRHDRDMLRMTAQLLVAPGNVVELRHIAPGWKGRKEIRSGYFDDLDALVLAAAACKGGNVYLTLNPAQPDLLSRRANRVAEASDGDTTGDAHIARRRWLLIDADPCRPSGISSTDEEKLAAELRIAEIGVWLESQGWPEPAFADSGNGFHLLFRIDLPNDEVSTQLIRRVLTAIADVFDDEKVSVDTSVFNASRITKFYGSVACKGDSTPSRPHRVSRLTIVPDEPEVVDRSLLEQLAGNEEQPVKSQPQGNHRNGTAFNVEEFLDRHLELRSHGPYENANGAEYRWKLATCPLCGESDKSAVVLRFKDGRIGFRCHHNRCNGRGWQDLRDQFEPTRPRPSGPNVSAPRNAELMHQHNRPWVELPGGKRSITAAASEFASLLAPRATHFSRGACVVRVERNEDDQAYLEPVRPSELASDLETVAQPTKRRKTSQGEELVPATCSRSAADLILSSQAFQTALPRLRVLSRCPLLVERNGALVEICGYDAATGVLAEGEPTPHIDVEEAVEHLLALVSGFRFATPSDRSRAIAAMITPALVLGGLLPGRAPIDLGEADQSQTGKGFRNKITAAIYRHAPIAVSQRAKGVGSMEEAFDRALIAGATFISLDNVRGKVDSPSIESFLTEDSYTARCAYAPPTMVDPRRVYVMFTSNKADITVDLANRASCVRLLKQNAGYRFPSYPEGDILSHVRGQQSKYLGAVFSIIRHWYAAGKPRTNESRHDFRAWAQVLDWIVREVFHLAPLIEGHRETQQRMSNPAMNWLRDVALAVVRHNRQNETLIANDFVEILDAEEGLEIPGLKKDASLENDTVRKQVWQQIGRRLKSCFGEHDYLEIDGLRIERHQFDDDRGHQRYAYQVVPIATDSLPPDEDLGRSASGGYQGEEPPIVDCLAPSKVLPPDTSPDLPLIVPPDKSRVSPDAADSSLISNLNGFSLKVRDVITTSGDQGQSAARTEVVL